MTHAFILSHNEIKCFNKVGKFIIFIFFLMIFKIQNLIFLGDNLTLQIIASISPKTSVENSSAQWAIFKLYTKTIKINIQSKVVRHKNKNKFVVIICGDHVNCFYVGILRTREISLRKNNSHDLNRVITHSLVLVIISHTPLCYFEIWSSIGVIMIEDVHSRYRPWPVHIICPSTLLWNMILNWCIFDWGCTQSISTWPIHITHPSNLLRNMILNLCNCDWGCT